LRAGQFVGLMFSRERNVVWKKHFFHRTNSPSVKTSVFVGRDTGYTCWIVRWPRKIRCFCWKVGVSHQKREKKEVAAFKSECYASGLITVQQ